MSLQPDPDVHDGIQDGPPETPSAAQQIVVVHRPDDRVEPVQLRSGDGGGDDLDERAVGLGE